MVVLITNGFQDSFRRLFPPFFRGSMPDVISVGISTISSSFRLGAPKERETQTGSFCAVLLISIEREKDNIYFRKFQENSSFSKSQCVLKIKRGKIKGVLFNQRVYLISLSEEKTPLTYETKQRTWIRIFLALSSEKDTNGGLNRFPWTETKSPASSSLFRGTFFKSISICNLSARYYM